MWQMVSAAGLPPGVLNVVYGPGPDIVQQLVADPRVKLITFTGSDKVGRILAVESAKHFKRFVCEQASKFDQDLGPTSVEAWPMFKRHFSMRIVSLSHLRMGNIGRRTPVTPRRRLTLCSCPSTAHLGPFGITASYASGQGGSLRYRAIKRRHPDGYRGQ